MLYSSGILDELDEFENMIGDKKYHSVEGVVTIYEMGYDEFTKFSDHRIAVEHINGCIKKYAALGETWRHSEDQHAVVFEFVCNVINLGNFHE